MIAKLGRTKGEKFCILNREKATWTEGRKSVVLIFIPFIMKLIHQEKYQQQLNTLLLPWLFKGGGQPLFFLPGGCGVTPPPRGVILPFYLQQETPPPPPCLLLVISYLPVISHLPPRIPSWAASPPVVQSRPQSASPITVAFRQRQAQSAHLTRLSSPLSVATFFTAGSRVVAQTFNIFTFKAKWGK